MGEADGLALLVGVVEGVPLGVAVAVAVPDGGKIPIAKGGSSGIAVVNQTFGHMEPNAKMLNKHQYN